MDSSGQVTVYVLSVKHPQDIFYDVPSHASSLTAQSHIDAADGFPAGALIPILTGSQLWSCRFFFQVKTSGIGVGNSMSFL